jgi:transcriptional regulator with XRE-family HTH domain
MPTDEQRRAFVEALEGELTTANRKTVAARLEVTKSQVSRWSKGRDVPAPDQVFAIEEALELPPGSLSRKLGYLPVGSSSVLAAVDADPKLSPKARRLLEVTYRSLASSVES